MEQDQQGTDTEVAGAWARFECRVAALVSTLDNGGSFTLHVPCDNGAVDQLRVECDPGGAAVVVNSESGGARGAVRRVLRTGEGSRFHHGRLTITL